MYKLLIVDDEEEVRLGIIRKTRWEDYDFILIGEATNGREALEIIEKEMPDVIITDISMPVMDGLQLTEEVKIQYPIIKIVILTGFEDFSFAQRAIKFGVEDYLSKPIHPEELNELLEKLKVKLDDEIKEKEDIYKLQKHYDDSLPILKDSFLTSLMHESFSSEEINHQINLHKLNLTGTAFAVSLSKIDGNTLMKNQQPKMTFELLNVAILHIANDIVKTRKIGEVFFYDNLLVIIFSIDCKDKDIVRNRLIKLLEEINQQVKHFLKITVTTGLGYIKSSVTHLPSSFQSAKTAFEYRLLLGGNKVIFIDDVEPKHNKSLTLDPEKESRLLNVIKFGSEHDVREMVKALLNYVGSGNITAKECQLYFLQISSFLIIQAEIFQIDSSVLFKEVSELFTKIISFATMEQVRNWFTNICLELRVEFTRKRATSTQKLVNKAKDYIEKNFEDSELTIQKLADAFFISPSYLSMIFKKELETTFLQYLISVRLEKSKELLENPENTISEVAQKVGYPDISYFSYFFKKNVGVSPREYKNSFIKGGS
ncbi:MAG: response regulator [Clostridia bacterium]|nr:response regulator [Clostridia bacterium]